MRCFAICTFLAFSWTISAFSQAVTPSLLAKAKAGDADAQNRLSFIYSQAGNSKESCRWKRTAAQNGNPEAQFSMGDYYELGLCGISKDYAQAASWYLKAAKQGDWMAQDSVASLYSNGQGVTKDYSQAAIWWRKAAEQDDANAQFSLGLAYFDGEGVPRDSKQAVQWFEKAAELRPANTDPEEWVRNTANKSTAKEGLIKSAGFRLF
jgi:uncharacterized protein